MLREAVKEDAQAIDAFLARTPETTMFLRSNLVHGIGWSDHSHSSRYFIWHDGRGIGAVFGLSKGGFLMGIAPTAVPASYAALAQVLAGETVVGMTGEVACVSSVLQACGLDKARYSLHHDEPLMAMALAGLKPSSDRLRRACRADLDTLRRWFASYDLETGIASDRDAAEKRAGLRAIAACEPASHARLMLDVHGQPCAMADINAMAGDTIQIGGVYVPEGLRGSGLGRRVVHGLLREAYENGARRAILFANSPYAERAYLDLGFREIGSYRVAILAKPEIVGALT